MQSCLLSSVRNVHGVVLPNPFIGDGFLQTVLRFFVVNALSLFFTHFFGRRITLVHAQVDLFAALYLLEFTFSRICTAERGFPYLHIVDCLLFIRPERNTEPLNIAYL